MRVFRPTHLDAQGFVDGNNLEEKRKISLVGYVAQSVGFGSEVILPQTIARERAKPSKNPNSHEQYPTSGSNNGDEGLKRWGATLHTWYIRGNTSRDES